MLRSIAVVLVSMLAWCASGWAQDSEHVIFSFNRTNGNLPDAGLVADSQGNLYGTTFNGGAYGYGNVYKLTPTAAGNWTGASIYDFTGGADGALPESTLVLDRAGNIYGTAQAGGLGQCVTDPQRGWLGCGVVFKLAPSGNGWQETTLYSFQPGVDKGVLPVGGVILDAAGNLYGTTWAPGVEGDFIALKAGKPSLANTFWGCDLPGCGGTVYKLTPTQNGWQETDLYDFTGATDGSSPQSSLLLDSAGNLYGTAPYGGVNNCVYGCGLVFKLSPDNGGWTETVLHAFTNQPDGGAPTGSVAMDAAGNLYSTTSKGGSQRMGTVFQITPGGQETVLYSFTGGNDGAAPAAGVVLDSHGDLFGTAPSGGQYFLGVAWRLTPNQGHWAQTVVHTFRPGTDGQSPYAQMIFLHGFLVGTTQSGGFHDIPGAVYQLLP